MDIHKFSWPESFNDSKGKSSIGQVCSFIMIVVASIIFLFAGFMKYGEGMMYATGFATLGGGLIGIRRFTKDKDVITMDNTNEDKTETL